MTVTVMKMHFQKFQPRVINYRNYKHFQNKNFRVDLLFGLSKLNIKNNDDGFTGFIETWMETLDQHVPCNQKHVRGNHLPFMNKTLSKEIMTLTRLRNRFLKNRTEENKRKYTKQRNYCVSLLRKVKNKHYSNLNEKDVTDNKMFWKTVKPFFSDKVTSSEKITLIEEDEIIGNDSDTARVLNTSFSNIVSNLKIPEYTRCDPLSDFISNPVLKSIVKYRNHPSILRIGEICHGSNAINFSFSTVQRTILNETTQLSSSKTDQSTDIPTKIINQNSDIFADFVLTSFNQSVANSIFPSSVKNVDITPDFNKGNLKKLKG